ncbi:MAG: DMT family transporter [Burkholderiales bacterium]|nr:DMT family transporter [Burkholderiales bacterium]
MSPNPLPESSAQRLWLAATPALFVFLWSTGFIGAKYGVPYAEPFTFLAIRMALASGLLLLLALAMKAPWPNARSAGHTAVAGLLVHGFYLGGVFYAVLLKVPLGQVALIVGLQPVLTAFLAGPLFGERLGRWQWLGIALGFLGVVLVVSAKTGSEVASLAGIACCVAALAGITAGTLYQKRFCTDLDIRTSGVIQFAATGVAFWLGALAIETRVVVWSGQFIFALGWLTLVLSLGAITLLYVLIRNGAAAKVASLFFLTPPVTAVMAFFLFGEVLSFSALLGLAVTAIGVALVARGK